MCTSPMPRAHALVHNVRHVRNGRIRNLWLRATIVLPVLPPSSRMAKLVNLFDFEARAKRILPKGVYDR